MTAVDPSLPYDPHNDPNSLYAGDIPKVSFNSVAMAFFAVLTLYQAGTGIYYRSWWFSIAVTLFTIGELIGYLGRVLSGNDITHKSLDNEDYFLLQFVSLVIAPNFLNGALYYQHSKMIVLYGKEFSKKIDALSISIIFIISDLICLIIQAIGGGMCGEALQGHGSMSQGQNVFVAGLAIQTFSMAVFQLFFFRLNYFIFIKTRIKYLKIYQTELQITEEDIKYYSKWTHWWKLIKFIPAENLEQFYEPKYAGIRLRNDKNRWMFAWFSFAVWSSFFAAFIRCIYRLVELADGGFNGYLITHEYFLVFLDFLPLLIGTIIISVVHPGAALLSREYSLPVKSINIFKKKNKNKNASDSEEDDSTFDEERAKQLEEEQEDNEEKENHEGIPDFHSSRESNYERRANEQDNTPNDASFLETGRQRGRDDIDNVLVV
ncbi:hypothetical protein ACO0QE_004733 [Hanseniaspora vineae]